MWKEKIKHTKGKKREEREKKKHTEEEKKKKKNRHLIFLLSVGDKRETLRLIFNTINCLMKHNNLSVVLVLGEFRAGKDVFREKFLAPNHFLHQKISSSQKTKIL